MKQQSFTRKSAIQSNPRRQENHAGHKIIAAELSTLKRSPVEYPFRHSSWVIVITIIVHGTVKAIQKQPNAVFEGLMYRLCNYKNEDSFICIQNGSKAPEGSYSQFQLLRCIVVKPCAGFETVRNDCSGPFGIYYTAGRMLMSNVDVDVDTNYLLLIYDNYTTTVVIQYLKFGARYRIP